MRASASCSAAGLRPACWPPNAGIAALALGLPLGIHALIVAGMILAGVSLGATAALLVAAVAAGLRSAHQGGNLVA